MQPSDATTIVCSKRWLDTLNPNMSPYDRPTVGVHIAQTYSTALRLSHQRRKQCRDTIHNSRATIFNMMRYKRKLVYIISWEHWLISSVKLCICGCPPKFILIVHARASFACTCRAASAFTRTCPFHACTHARFSVYCPYLHRCFDKCQAHMCQFHRC